MRLIADRFAQDDSGAQTIDLATGRRVVLHVGTAGGATEQARWSARCDALQQLHHPAIARLVDFGIVGASSRFEAWECGGEWAGSADQRRRVAKRAETVFRASGLTAGGGRIHASAHGAVLIPEAGSGYSCDAMFENVAGIESCGLIAIQRSATRTLAEMFRVANTPRPHVAALWGPRGSGKRSAVLDAARAARLQGFVPIAGALVGTRLAALCAGRSLFVIDDRAHAAWQGFLRVLNGPAHPHVLLIVSTEEVPGVEGIPLTRVDPQALVSALTPRAIADRYASAVHRAVRQSQGWPGRFARLVWPQWAGTLAPREASIAEAGRERRGPARRAAEHAAAYGTDADSGALVENVAITILAAPPGGWPAPGELASLRRRTDGALAEILRGRHAPGMRHLRQAVGGLARRAAWADAAAGAVALADTLLARGRPRDAQSVLDAAREYADRCGDAGRSIDIALLTGVAWTDLARLDEAESVLAGALTVAKSTGDRARIEAVRLALARCLYWRGEYADAETALGSPPAADDTASAVRYTCQAARIALGLADVRRAMSLAASALDLAAAGSSRFRAAAAYTQALVHLVVDDFDAVDRAVANAIAAARTAHDPVRAVRARLLRAEADRRRGQMATMRGELERLKRFAAAVPPIVRSRWELVMTLATGANPGDTVARLSSASGLGALRLFAPEAAAGSHAASDAALPDVLAILQACQNADDEGVVLKDVCDRLKQRLHAACVSVVVPRGDRPETLAGSGDRPGGGFDAIATRVLEASATIAPYRGGDRTEGGAAVMYGGAPIAALVARWAAGSTYDLTRAPALLATAAAAVAPVVSAAIARRTVVSAGPLAELLGVTPAMADLRSAIEKAASAPFAVLITGESGSGKELVARAVHRMGPRRSRAFCSLNCAALPDDLVETELFGHARGSFTGAVSDRPGVFEEADGGTLFLDEVGELSLRAQAKLLRVIQEGELRRIGENVSRRVDVRIISATNRDLQTESAAGRFRIDLLYRLDVIRLAVPPLRERREDIAVIADAVWRDATSRLGSRAVLSAPVLAALASYNWPGNVRELQNVLASLAVRVPKRGVVPPTALPAVFGARVDEERCDFVRARRTFEENFIRAALVRSGGHRGRAADELGVSRQGLTKLMNRLGISEPAVDG